jgi:hypothetical protein
MEQNVTLSRFLNLLVSFSYPSTVLQHGNVQYNPSVVTGGGGGQLDATGQGKGPEQAAWSMDCHRSSSRETTKHTRPS